MIINKIQDYCTLLFPINSLVVYHIFLKTFKSEYDEITVWLIDQNSQHRMNLTMVVK